MYGNKNILKWREGGREVPLSQKDFFVIKYLINSTVKSLKAEIGKWLIFFMKLY